MHKNTVLKFSTCALEKLSTFTLRVLSCVLMCLHVPNLVIMSDTVHICLVFRVNIKAVNVAVRAIVMMRSRLVGTITNTKLDGNPRKSKAGEHIVFLDTDSLMPHHLRTV